MDAPAQRRLEAYFTQLGQDLKNDSQRASFALYGLGLLGEGERKSVEPIAARISGADVDGVDPLHQRLLHFVGPAKWSDEAIRLRAARYAIDRMVRRGPIESAIFDDTGFLKQGRHSVGVKRQYTGSAGKVTNCQVAVSLTLTTRTDHVPVDMQLYLPDTWAHDPVRRKEAKIPDEVVFQTKPQIALAMLQRAHKNHLPLGRVLADCAYGDNAAFRKGVRELDLDYGVGIQGHQKVYGVNRRGFRHPQAIRVDQWAAGLNKGQFRCVSWRQGTGEMLSARFAFRRVVLEDDEQQEEMWLVIERPRDKPKTFKYHLVTGPRTMKKKEIIRRLKERYRTEQMYQETKGGLGLDHYEGRRYPGWNHHVSLVLSCYAFVVAERVRHFPPSASGSRQTYAQRLAA